MLRRVLARPVCNITPSHVSLAAACWHGVSAERDVTGEVVPQRRVTLEDAVCVPSSYDLKVCHLLRVPGRERGTIAGPLRASAVRKGRWTNTSQHSPGPTAVVPLPGTAAVEIVRRVRGGCRDHRRARPGAILRHRRFGRHCILRQQLGRDEPSIEASQRDAAERAAGHRRLHAAAPARVRGAEHRRPRDVQCGVPPPLPPRAMANVVRPSRQRTRPRTSPPRSPRRSAPGGTMATTRRFSPI